VQISGQIAGPTGEMDGPERYGPSGYRDRNRRRRMSQASVVASIDPDMQPMLRTGTDKTLSGHQAPAQGRAMTHVRLITQAGHPIAPGDDTGQISLIVPPVTS
jgi:hypothetical protein